MKGRSEKTTGTADPAVVNELQGKGILLVVGGGIAAYKSLELVRRLRERGSRVQVVVTAAAKQFIAPMSFSALAGNPVREELFDAGAESGLEAAGMGHIELARFGDLVIVAPATADLLARMAAGLANDLATASLLASNAPLLLAPAMNPHMWTHAATRRNLARLQTDGAMVVGPGKGETACGEEGIGRMAEVAEIVRAAGDILAASDSGLLAGRRALVTSGPTFEAIDSLRYISNRSSGRQGHAIAAALKRAGAETLLIHGPCERVVPDGIASIAVESARDMLEACEAALPVDIAVMAAAVGDWRIADPGQGKIHKTASSKPIVLELVENPDILKNLSRNGSRRPSLVLGFAVENGTPEEILERARAKRKSKGCDWIAANAIEVMGKKDTRLQLITSDSVEQIAGDKISVAALLVERISRHINKSPARPPSGERK